MSRKKSRATETETEATSEPRGGHMSPWLRVGDDVLFVNDEEQREPFAAKVVRVLESGRVNVIAWDEKGCQFSAHDVPLFYERRNKDDVPFVVERSNRAFDQSQPAQEPTEPVKGEETEPGVPPDTEQPEPVKGEETEPGVPPDTEQPEPGREREQELTV